MMPLQSLGGRRARSDQTGGDIGLIDRLRQASVISFSTSQKVSRDETGGHIPALLEFLNIPYTGSDPLTLSLTLDKAMAKRIVISQDIPTPRFKKVERMEDLDDLDLRYPLFVKLCYEGSSKGVRLDSKILVLNLERKSRGALETYGLPPRKRICESPEFTVGILATNSSGPRRHAD